jgi:predicted nucleotidyltransferase
MLKKDTLIALREQAKEYGVKKLLLFGSCLYKLEDDAGDIDLAVYGLDKQKFLEFYGEILTSSHIKKKIDLVDMNDDVYITPYILENGAIIYETEDR